MSYKYLLQLFCLLGAVAQSLSYRYYQDRIPNGDMIPHPCKPNFIWRGVGHLNALGGGAKNSFGIAFAEQGHQWTKELCEADSDGDGMTNGQELGDPNCVWTEISGHFPERMKQITHPGVCDPFDSSACEKRNANIKCDGDEFNCPAIHETHVRNITLRFPRTLVPAVETSYMCMSFEVQFPQEDPVDAEYHLIATQPVIDNPNVMHHTALFSCRDSAKMLKKPELCYMSPDGCFDLVGQWTIGMTGECVYEEAGFKLSKQATRRLMMQHHWTNPELVEDYYDSSGMILYYTTKLRKYNAGFFMTGQSKLEIPPGQDRWVHKATCSPECTNHNIKGSINLMTGLNHMHYLGFKENVELFRNDGKVADLTPDDQYSYDNPVIHQYNPPKMILPGDRLEITCVYRSTPKTRTTYIGEGTYDEMCFSIFTYYPAENLTYGYCGQWGTIEQCGRDNEMTKSCNMGNFYNTSHPDTKAVRKLILDHCNFYGPCRSECPAAIAKAKKDNPCLQGEVGEFVLWNLNFRPELETLKFLSAFASCDCPVKDDEGEQRNTKTDNNLNNVLPSGSSTVIPSLVTLVVFLFGHRM